MNSTMDGWRVITSDLDPNNDPVLDRLFDEAMAAAPKAYTEPNPGIMLPRKPTTGKCALCGTTTALTREHIPPEASGNTERTMGHSLDDWLNRKSLDDLGRGPVQQGGIWGYTLCGGCNSTSPMRASGRSVAWLRSSSANPTLLIRYRIPVLI